MYEELSDEKVASEIERIAGRIEPDGASLPPSHRYHQEVRTLANEVQTVRLYPRDDLTGMPSRMREQVAAFFAPDSHAIVPTSSTLDTRYGQPARRVHVAKIGREGQQFPPLDAARLLRLYPLVLTARAPKKKPARKES